MYFLFYLLITHLIPNDFKLLSSSCMNLWCVVVCSGVQFVWLCVSLFSVGSIWRHLSGVDITSSSFHLRMKPDFYQRQKRIKTHCYMKVSFNILASTSKWSDTDNTALHTHTHTHRAVFALSRARESFKSSPYYTAEHPYSINIHSVIPLQPHQSGHAVIMLIFSQCNYISEGSLRRTR